MVPMTLKPMLHLNLNVCTIQHVTNKKIQYNIVVIYYVIVKVSNAASDPFLTHSLWTCNRTVLDGSDSELLN